MIRNIALFFIMLLPSMTYAQLDSQFTFNGQNAETLRAEKQVTITTSEEVEVPDTCYSQVPYEENVCRQETRHRESCTWVPSSQHCWNDTERVCRPVTRTRQECSNGASRRVCTERPSRQVCTERPTRRVCTTRPDGRQHCTEVGGGTHCTTVGGGQDCHEVPGERHCRTVTYTEQDCDNVSRRRCETVPGRNECTDVPYSETVCGTETRYRSEPYACTSTRTINRFTEKTIKAETNVQIITNGLVEEFPVGISIKEQDSNFKSFSIEAKLLAEPKLFVVLKKKEVTIASVTEEEILLKSEVILEVLSKEMLPIAFPTGIMKATLEEATSKLVIIFEGPVSSQGAVDLLITHKALLSRKQTIAELKAEYPGEKAELSVIDGKAALSIDLKEAMQNELKKKNMLLKLDLSSHLDLQGELMNATKPETSKLYEGTFVEVK